MDHVAELGAIVGLEMKEFTTTKVSIHEDNAGALVLMQTIPPQFTPCSKYYAIKTVWFQKDILKHTIKLLKIDTVQQLGDIFTNGLTRATPSFEDDGMVIELDCIVLREGVLM